MLKLVKLSDMFVLKIVYWKIFLMFFSLLGSQNLINIFFQILSKG